MERDLGCTVMNNEQIREVVRITIEELLSQNALKDPYPSIKKEVESRLKDFFNGKNNVKIGYILNQLSDDEYLDIIFLYYRDGCTLEKIAEILDRDTTTISRNRKRLIQEIYLKINEAN